MNRPRYWLLLAVSLILLLAFGLTVHVDTFTGDRRVYSQTPRVTWGEGWFQHWQSSVEQDQRSRDQEQREHELRLACLSSGRQWHPSDAKPFERTVATRHPDGDSTSRLPLSLGTQRIAPGTCY